jgi:Dolichyl-phosphate-mannose-protein mannosyltransferase
MSPDLAAKDKRRITGLVTSAALILWLCFVYLAAHPLTEAPVIDSWIYEHAVMHFNRTGRIQFAGFTEALPVAQVLYGVAWSRVLGETSRSLDISTALLGVGGGLLFYQLARKCGAEAWTATIAAALLICNPCYLFLSFSFMTEVPFLAVLLASYAAFAYASHRLQWRWLWLAAAGAAVGFAIRPFGAATIVGEASVLLIPRNDQSDAKSRTRIVAIVPFIAALMACAGFWIWLTRLNPKPWMLEYHEYRLRTYFTMVPLRSYLARGMLEPAIYLGIVLSPLGVLHAIPCWRRSVVIATAILASSIIILRLDHEPVWNLEQATCFGGSYSALVLNGVPQHDFSAKLAWMLFIVGGVGFAGICNACWEAIHNDNRAVLAMLFAGVIYWAAMPFLWFFADRYDLVLVPAACLPLALAPLPRRTVAVPIAGLMTAALALVSVAGLVSYHRTMQKIVMETDVLLRQGIPRMQIDAGYSLNGRDLYIYPAQGIDTARDEPRIPLITTPTTLPYVISTSPIRDTVIWRRFSGCGPLGFGHRPLFVLRATRPSASP